MLFSMLGSATDYVKGEFYVLNVIHILISLLSFIHLFSELCQTLFWALVMAHGRYLRINIKHIFTTQKYILFLIKGNIYCLKMRNLTEKQHFRWAGIRVRFLQLEASRRVRGGIAGIWQCNYTISFHPLAFLVSQGQR